MLIFCNSITFCQLGGGGGGLIRSPQSIIYDINHNLNSNINNHSLNLSINTHTITNSGHPNLDNIAELFVPGTSTKLISTRLEYSTPWLSLSLEPYTISYNGNLNNAPASGTYNSNNNHSLNNYAGKTKIGFRQSRLILHYKGIGVGYGNMSHWWGPGFHSALALSNNAPSQETYALGTFKDIRIGQFSFGSQIIVMPYESMAGSQLYFSGLKAHVTHHSSSVAITLGFHRTYLSGDFSNLSSTTVSTNRWSLIDAVGLVIEPLFGQSKKDLGYTLPGTPGFDAWDEVLTGFVKISLPELGLAVYADVASDDNRGNFSDLKAHWDHTLGYQLGFTKITKLNRYNLFIGVEFLTTRVSNTFNPSFFRGNPNTDNYYAKIPYDYFTYQGRRMGAHSGSSSDDLIFVLGMGDNNMNTYVSYNKERHGIKSMTFPELKTEYVMSFNRKISDYHTAFITLEYEKIKNFGFIQDDISISKLVWLGYTFSIH